LEKHCQTAQLRSVQRQPEWLACRWLN